LKFLARNCNLNDSESVREFIANKECGNSYKIGLVKAYNYYAVVNGIQWIKPKYKSERKIPKIPTTEAINKIISIASKKYATIFKILMETGVMPYELSNVTLRDIDLEKGTLSVQGFKGHASRIFKLKSETIAMLREYLAKHGFNDKPFPDSEYMGKMWRRYRNKTAEKLKEPQLKTIRLYDLRHYFATMLYYRTRDPLLVKQLMGHKKLETILIYTQLVNFKEDEYHSATATTIKEARRLIEQGFEYVTEIDGVKLFRKRK
jgi:integrase